jgi:DNA-binding PadR family transcriptional regulator
MKYRLVTRAESDESLSPIQSQISRVSKLGLVNCDMYDLTGFQRDLLYVVAGLDDPHGLAIKDELGDYYEKEIHHGRLYPNLDTLVEKGLIEKSQRDRRTNEYSTTRRGTREIEARTEWEAGYIDHKA